MQKKKLSKTSASKITRPPGNSATLALAAAQHNRSMQQLSGWHGRFKEMEAHVPVSVCKGCAQPTYEKAWGGHMTQPH